MFCQYFMFTNKKGEAPSVPSLSTKYCEHGRLSLCVLHFELHYRGMSFKVRAGAFFALNEVEQFAN